MTRPENLELEVTKFDRQGRVGILTLDRPDRLNAVSRRTIAEINQVLDGVAEDDRIGALVLTGAGRAFCSGVDLKDDAAAGPTDRAGWRQALQADFDFMMRFWHFEKPTIAAVHGYCLAAGCELAMCCDVTIAEEGTFFGEPELMFGSVITAMMMPWLTGPKIAKELLLSANDRVPAERALQIGLVNQVTPKGEYLKEAIRLARRMATVDPEAIALTKRAINSTFDFMGLKEALNASLDVAVDLECLETESRRKFREITEKEGLQAALEWRNGRFGGD